MGKAATALVAFLTGVILTVTFTRPQSDAGVLHAWLKLHPEFLADNPDLVAAAGRIVHGREIANDVHWRKQLVADRWQTYLDPVFTPSLGARSAATVLVEFTDYACEPCRASASAVKGTLQGHAGIRVALVLLPSSGGLAEYAARVAFAGYRQNPDRFATLHERLLSMTGPLTNAAVLRAAQDAGLDTEQIEVDLRSAEVRQYIARAAQFAQDLHVTGVPFFLLDGRTLAGGASAAKLNSFLGPDPVTAAR